MDAKVRAIRRPIMFTIGISHVLRMIINSITPKIRILYQYRKKIDVNSNL
jgi:hypothetical protein